jgi:hypothetical protein
LPRDNEGLTSGFESDIALFEVFVKQKRFEDDIGRMREGCASSGVFVEVKDISIVGRRRFLYLCSCWCVGVGRSRERVKISEFDMAKSAYQVDQTVMPKLAVKTDGNLHVKKPSYRIFFHL